MLVLYETPAGYALFKVRNESKLHSPEDLFREFETPEAAHKLIELKAFSKFGNTAEALEATASLVEGKLGKDLKKFLTSAVGKKDLKDTLAVTDPKLGAAISKKLEIKVISDATVMELVRGIRSQIAALVEGISEAEFGTMALGLSHSLSRYKLKFSPDKVDTMIIQAIALLDDLDKELNTYAMRLKEWYGWHFPELGKIVTDNLAFAKTVRTLGLRTSAADADLTAVLPEELIADVKSAAEISMGTEISDEDLENIFYLADQIISISQYRSELYEYLKNRMNAIAPNLTAMVGDLVGARLISHAGSLMNLAKHPASTVQILGAEKALFRALKTKHDTPKYGLIYHASLVGQAGPKLKGKISRVLAAKTALSIRCDAFGEGDSADVGIENRLKVEERLRQLEGRPMSTLHGVAKAKPQQQKYEFVKGKAYNPAADLTEISTKQKRKAEPVAEEEVKAAPKPKKAKKEEKEEKPKKSKEGKNTDVKSKKPEEKHKDKKSKKSADGQSSKKDKKDKKSKKSHASESESD